MRLTIAFLSIFAAATAAHGSQLRAIQSVKIDRPSLNIAAGDSVTLTVTFAQPGTASIRVLDRDGYVVRVLANAQPVHAGAMSFGWDAHDDNAQLVADEAYSFKIDWLGASGIDTYFPADTPQALQAIDARAYDRRTATLSYSLPQPSRVHIQAGTATLDPKTKQPVGPVMKTIVNREPRAGGSIAEHWSGYDESGTLYVSDLENFVVAIAATPLPENSVITFGNRQRRFVDTLSSRRGASLLTAHAGHEHHRGLRTQDDVSPVLKIEALNAAWSSLDRRWNVEGEGSLQLRLSVEGPTAAAFRTHPATIELFVDGRPVGSATRKTGDVVSIHIGSGGTHRVSVNWNSEWGPVAANTIQVRVGGLESATGATR